MVIDLPFAFRLRIRRRPDPAGGWNRQAAAAALNDLAAEFSDSYFHRKRIADALAARDLDELAIARYREIFPLVKHETDKRCEVLRQLGRS